jgi:integrase
VNLHTRPGHRYGPLASGSISTLINRLSARVGERAYGPHAIRHWRGQTLADQRLPPTLVQAILGHRDVRITLDHYYNQDISRLQRVLESYEVGQGLAGAGAAAQ